MDREVMFEIQGDKLVRYTPIPEYGENTCKMDVLMDKETFIKCFQKWIRYEDEPSREGMTVLPLGNPVTDITDEIMGSERMKSIIKDLNQRLKQLDYKGCYNCKYATKSKRMCDWGVNGGDGHLHFICHRWEKRDSK